MNTWHKSYNLHEHIFPKYEADRHVLYIFYNGAITNAGQWRHQKKPDLNKIYHTLHTYLIHSVQDVCTSCREWIRYAKSDNILQKHQILFMLGLSCALFYHLHGHLCEDSTAINCQQLSVAFCVLLMQHSTKQKSESFTQSTWEDYFTSKALEVSLLVLTNTFLWNLKKD